MKTAKVVTQQRYSMVVWLSCALLLISAGYARAEDWMVRRETSSGVCHVQRQTAASLGKDLSGPFSSRKAACEDAKKRFEAATTDREKCGAYGNGTVTDCKSEDVALSK